MAQLKETTINGHLTVIGGTFSVTDITRTS